MDQKRYGFLISYKRLYRYSWLLHSLHAFSNISKGLPLNALKILHSSSVAISTSAHFQVYHMYTLRYGAKRAEISVMSFSLMYFNDFVSRELIFRTEKKERRI